MSMTSIVTNSPIPCPLRDQASDLLALQTKSEFSKPPIEILLTILSAGLSPKTIASLSLTCKGFQVLTADNDLWRLLFNRDFAAPLPEGNRKEGGCLKAYQMQHQQKILAIDQNITNGVYGLHTLRGHEARISCVLIVGTKLISGSHDKTIRIWDIETGVCISTLTGHESEVFSLIISEGKIVSGDNRGTIKIWDLETGILLSTLTGHEGAIKCLVSANGKIFSGSEDCSMRIWDLKTGECLSAIEDFYGGVSLLLLADGKLISADDSGAIKIWDVETHALLETYREYEEERPSLVIADGKLIAGYRNGTIRIWALKTGALLNIFEGHKDAVLSLALAEGKLVSSAQGEAIRIWNLETNECLTTLKMHHRSVRSLIITRSKIFSGSGDSTIRTWDLKTGSCLNTLVGHDEDISSMDIVGPRLISSSCDHTIKIWDFSVPHEAVFAQIIHLFKSGDVSDNEEAKKRFFRMPDRAKSEIYGELDKILWPPNLYSTPIFSEYAFNDVHGLHSTSAQKAQAIENYLNLQNSRPSPSKILNTDLLLDLKVITSEDYSEKLKCHPEFLSEVGISSLADLEVLGVKPCPRIHLPIPEVSAHVSANRIEIQNICWNKKSDLLNFLKEMHFKVERNLENYAFIDPFSENPWTLFGEKIEELYAEIEKSSENQAGLISLFEPEPHSNLVTNVNALIDEFNTLDQVHQIKKLSAYISQWGLLRAWQNLQGQGIHSLSELVQQRGEISNKHLFKMGE